MMGATHGLAGVLTGGLLALAASRTGADVDLAAAAAVITTATIAAELPDLDTAQSRISHGGSTLTAVPMLRFLALPVTLPLVLVGCAIRGTGVTHRGPTHSIAAGALWAAAIVPLYAAYFALLAWALPALADYAGAPASAIAQLQQPLDQLTGAWASVGLWPAIATAAGYASHLLLDAMTRDTQQIAWPLSNERRTLRRPSIRVGGLGEAALITTPIAIAVIALAWTHTEPLAADLARSLPSVPAAPHLPDAPELGLPSIALPAPTQLP